MNFRYVNGYMFREDYETVIEAQQFLNKLEVIIPHSGGWAEAIRKAADNAT